MFIYLEIERSLIFQNTVIDKSSISFLLIDISWKYNVVVFNKYVVNILKIKFTIRNTGLHRKFKLNLQYVSNSITAK